MSDKVYKTISQQIRGSFTDTIKARTFREIDRLKITVDRIDNIDSATAGAINRLNTALEEANNSLSLLSAVHSHKLEENDELRNVASDMSNTATLMGGLKEIAKNDPDFIREFLFSVNPEIFKPEFNKLNPARQRELLPELFMDGE